MSSPGSPLLPPFPSPFLPSHPPSSLPLPWLSFAPPPLPLALLCSPLPSFPSPVSPLLPPFPSPFLPSHPPSSLPFPSPFLPSPPLALLCFPLPPFPSPGSPLLPPSSLSPPTPTSVIIFLFHYRVILMRVRMFLILH